MKYPHLIDLNNKTAYSAPQISVIDIETEDVLCQSPQRVSTGHEGFGPGDDGTDF